MRSSLRRSGYISLSILALVVLLTLSRPPTWSSAQVLTDQVDTACSNVEVVFVVDQSGSMGGREAGSTIHPRPNDPLKLRFFAPVFAMRWLGNEYLVSRGIPGRQQMTFHIAVVNFGSTAEPKLGWTTLDPKDQASWTTLQTSLEQQLAPGRLANANLGETNFVDAFQKTADLFARRGPQQDGCPRRAVVLLTDGEPAIQQTGFSIASHMSQVATIVRERMPAPGYQMYVTSINDPDKPGYWDTVKDSWSSIAQDAQDLPVRRSQLVRTSDEVADRLNRILFELAHDEPPPPPPPERFIVRPYLQEIDLVFYKQDPREHLDVSDEQGALNTSRSDVKVEIVGYNDPIETLRVIGPQPGYWTRKTTSSRNNVLMNVFEIPAAGVLNGPTGSDARQFVRTPVEFQLVNSRDGAPLPEYTDPRYQIQITATIAAAGRTWPVTVRRGPQQSFVADFIPVESGKHTVTVHGIAQDTSGQAFDVINGPLGDFLVEPVSLELLEGLADPPDGCAGHRQGAPLSVAFGLRTPDGADVHSDIPIKWNAGVAADGKSWLLTVEGPSTTGMYSTTFTPEVGGAHEMHVAASLIEPIDGVERPMLDARFPFRVIATDIVDVKLLQPQTGTRLGNQLRLQWRFPFFRFEPLPTEVELQFSRVADGTPIDPAIISDADPAQLVALTVRDPATGQSVGDVVGLRPDATPGRLKAQIVGLALGSYEIGVQPRTTATVRCGFAWAGTSAITTIRRTQDPQWYWLLAAFGVVAVSLAGAGSWYASLIYRPLEGWLVILDAQGKRVPGGNYPLGGRNRHVFKNIPAVVGAQRIEIRRNRNNQKELSVIVVPENSPPWEAISMVPGRSVRITNNYSLLYVLNLGEIQN